jgi:hypothetical protein
MIVTAKNCNQLSSGTLLKVYDEMRRFESDDIEKEVEVLDLQTVVGNTLESRGWIYDEEDREYYYPVHSEVVV